MLAAGPPPREAGRAVILLHGRGASAEDILSLYERLELPGLAALAPQAAGSTWYPRPFLSPLEENQPHLDSALDLVGSLLNRLSAEGVPPESTALLGFSQGACLTVEYAARNPRRYGALLALTGGLIGARLGSYPGSLVGTPVLLGTSEPDPFVPVSRVLETERVLAAMGAVVQVRRYPGMPHTVNDEEIRICRELLEGMGR